MTYTYVLNRNSKTLHLKVDGKSDERCNLDQLTDKLVSPLPPREITYKLCSRKAAAGKYGAS